MDGLRQLHGFTSRARFTYEQEMRIGFEERAQPLPHIHVIFGQQDPDGRASRGFGRLGMNFGADGRSFLREAANKLLNSTKHEDVKRLAGIVGTLLYRCDLLEREVERLERVKKT